jgi:hypothetical protein
MIAPMNRRELEEALHELKDQLDSGAPIDADSRSLLLELQSDIEELLARPAGEPVESPKALDERLTEALIHFEGSHPSLTVTLNRVVNALAQMGI